jgi:heat shock protein HslJ
MSRSTHLVGAVLITMLAAGCAGQDPAPGPAGPAPSGGSPGSAGTEVDPIALIGLWSVTGAAGEKEGAVLRIASEGLSLWRDCGTLMGAWRADTGGLFVADLHSSTGCPASNPLTPAWLSGATAYQVAGKDRVLLDGRGEPVARLLPGGKPQPNPNVAPQEAQPPVVTDEARRALARPAELPTGLVAPDPGALVGRWVPEDGRGSGPEPAHLEFRADGGWAGSDGCNGLGGRWVAGVDGALLATNGPSTLIGCDNSPVGQWLADARRVGLDGEKLVLVNAAGKELGRLRPDR